MKKEKNTISILVNNRPDVLARIAGTFSGRGFNIESISANVTMDPAITKIIITTISDKETVIKLEKQLNKIVDVLDVVDLMCERSVQREMVLIRIKMTDVHRDSMMRTIDTNKWKVVSTTTEFCVVEVTGSKKEVENALVLFEPLGMDDFTRTGAVAVEI